MRTAFAKAVYRAMTDDKSVVLIIGDIGYFSLKQCFDEFPDRCYNVGTCEQSMVSMAAGLATQGFYPIVHSISPFLVARAYEQIRIDFGYQCLKGLFVSVGASFDYASMGATHHGTEIPWLMHMIDGMRVLLPSTAEQACDIILEVIEEDSLAYVQLAEYEKQPVHRKTYANHKALVLAVGTCFHAAAAAASLLDFGVEVGMVSDVDLKESRHIYRVQQYEKIITIEPYRVGLLAVQIHRRFPGQKTVYELGPKVTFDRFYGTRQDHEKHHMLDAESIASSIRLLLA